MIKEKILLGMSGGLDSTYAVLKLRESGYEVFGAILIMSEKTDISAAVRSADALDVPLRVIECSEKFEKHVISDFISSYVSGKTPNPCVICNPAVKFRALTDTADEMGIRFISTGHYADVKSENGRYYLTKASDVHKDQTYVLWKLSQEVLSRLVFPMAGIVKSEVRAESERLGLPTAGMKDSTDICFIPDGDYAGYIAARGIVSPPGDFIDENGKVIGRHHGIVNYTLGQHKGLGISVGKPLYVSETDVSANTVRLTDEDKLYSRRFSCSGLNFMKLPPDTESGSFKVKVRYAAKPVCVDVNIKGDRAECVADEPLRAVTPGQSAVFYDGDDVAFGGIIGTES